MDLKCSQYLTGDSQYRKYILDPSFEYYLRNHYKPNQKKYIYLITFTLKDQNPTPQFIDEVETYIIAQSKREALQITKYSYVKEHTKAGVPHWHVSVTTYKRIKKTDSITTFSNMETSTFLSQRAHQILRPKTTCQKKEMLRM